MRIKVSLEGWFGFSLIQIRVFKRAVSGSGSTQPGSAILDKLPTSFSVHPLLISDSYAIVDLN